MTDPGQRPAILSVGRFYCDLIFTDLPRLPSLGTEVYADGFGVHAGGGAYITAAHLAALGHPSALSAMLPETPFAEMTRAELEESAIDLSLSQTLPRAAGPQVTVAMTQSGDRAFLSKRAGPAFPTLSARMLRTHNFRHIHVGELASLAAQPEIVGTARALGMTVSVDCGWDEDLTPEALRPLIGLVDVFLPNDAEMDLLRSMGLAESFASLTIVKLGSKGSMALTQDGVVHAPTKAIQAIDTTGAGDAFNAGFLSHWVTGAPLSSCLEAGNARGALSIQRRGGYVPNPNKTAATDLVSD